MVETGFDVSLLNVSYLWFPNPYVYHGFTSNTSIAAPTDRVIYGTAKVISSFWFLIFQLAYVPTLRRRCGFMSDFSFTLLYCIGIVDIIQLFLHLITGLMLATQMTSHEYTYIFGALMNPGFFLTGYITMMLPIHRALYILVGKYAPLIAPKKALQVLLGLFVVTYFGWVIFFFTPYSGIAYIPESVYWSFTVDKSKPLLNTVMRLFEEYSVMFPIVVAVPLYSLIIAHVCKKGKNNTRRELKLTAQILLVIVVTSICYFNWYYLLSAVRTDDKHFIRFISDMVWVLYNGMNPVIYFLFHRDIRRQMKMILSCGRLSKGPTSQNVPSTTAQTQNTTLFAQKTNTRIMTSVH